MRGVVGLHTQSRDPHRPATFQNPTQPPPPQAQLMEHWKVSHRFIRIPHRPDQLGGLRRGRHGVHLESLVVLQERPRRRPDARESNSQFGPSLGRCRRRGEGGRRFRRQESTPSEEVDGRFRARGGEESEPDGGAPSVVVGLPSPSPASLEDSIECVLKVVPDSSLVDLPPDDREPSRFEDVWNGLPVLVSCEVQEREAR